MPDLHHFLEQISVMEYVFFLLRILLACVCGAAIGYERSRRSKSAGIRTHIIVCCAAALIMIVSKYGFVDLTLSNGQALSGTRGADPARIAAQVVSGISFLGAGIIVKHGSSVKGLTTAAGIWATAGIGLAIGAGMYVLGVFTMIVISIIQFVMHKIKIDSEGLTDTSVDFNVTKDPEFNKQFLDRVAKWNAHLEEIEITDDTNGEFPNWVISEVSRNVEVSGRLSYCSVSDSVFILGRNEVQNIQTTTAYGDMKPIDVATLITNQIQTLPANAMLRYVPPLSQIWAVSGRNALMFDLPTQSWYKRRFNSPVIDVIPIGDEVIIVKGDRVSRLSDDTFYDDGAPMQWRWQGQRLVSQNDYFLKRTQISVSPIGKLCKGEIRVGAVAIEIPVEEHLTSVVEGGRRKFLTIKGTDIFENHSEIFENPQPIFYGRTLIAESRNVYRNKFLDIGGHGSAGGVIFNWITLDVAEV